MEQVLDVIRKRRTVRAFTDEEVTDEQVETILQMAMYAPTYMNRQPWHFVVVRDKELQKSLGETLGVRPYIQQASAVIAVYGDPNISNTWDLDGCAAIENMLIAATALGLGSAWAGSPGNLAWGEAEQLMKDALEVPAGFRALSLVCLGHPAKMVVPHTKDERYNKTRVHYGTWRELKS
ncbi:MAG TPA: nitroreductase family protein [Anaerolineae bacterium]|nr:nitroreductase family protein [Anaerolineae bacterium]